MKLLALKAAIFGVVLAVAVVFVMSVSGPYEDGLDAYHSGDYATALRLWRPLAEQGYAPAQNKLGFMHRKGRGVPRGFATAVKWFRLAAERGHARAQYNLGFSYENGGGVRQDFVQAHMWFSLAASRFLPGKDRDRAAQGRDMLASLMTPAQISEAQNLAREWRPRGEQVE